MITNEILRSPMIVLLSVVCSLSLSLSAAVRSQEPQQAETISPETRVANADEAFNRSDIVAAMRELRYAAEAGYVPAQVKLAGHLDYAEEDEEAFGWYQSAARVENAEAQFNLGRMYASGEGTGQDYSLALEWFSRSGEQGYVPAIRMLAKTYESGGAIAEISYERAVEWLNAGVAAGDLWTTRRLSNAYRLGQLGLRVNREKAAALNDQAGRLAGERLDAQNEEVGRDG